MHYQSGSFVGRHVAALARSADAAVRRAVKLIDGDGGYRRPIDVFYLDSREQMFELVGLRVTGYADWESSSVFLVCNPTWRSFDTHEITHVVSINVWGEPAEPASWIREGLAVYSDGRCRGHSVQAIAAEFRRRDELPHATDLIHRFPEVGEMPGYLGSGSFVGFLVESYGAEVMKQVWQRGSSAIEEILGSSLEELDDGWRSSLSEPEAGIPESEWELLMTRGCG